jgi:hypothetical protein
MNYLLSRFGAPARAVAAGSNVSLGALAISERTAHYAKARNMACVAVNCLGRYHLANAFVENRSLARKIVALGSGGPCWSGQSKPSHCVSSHY